MLLFRYFCRTKHNCMGYKYCVYKNGAFKTLTFKGIVEQRKDYPEIKEIDVNSESFILEGKNGVKFHSNMIPTVDSNGNLLNNAVSVVGVEKFGNIILQVKVVPSFNVSDWGRNIVHQSKDGTEHSQFGMNRDRGVWLDYATLQTYVSKRGLRLYNGVFENGVFVPIFESEPDEIKVKKVNETELEPYNFYVYDGNHIIISGIKPWYQDVKMLRIPSYVSRLTDLCFANISGIEQVKSTSEKLCIGGYSFSGCQNLKKVLLRTADIKGVGAFSGCQSLKEVSFSCASAIGESTFENCVGLRKVNIDTSTAQFTIGVRAFAGCRDMTLDMHHSHLIECGNGVFYGAENIRVIADKSVLDIFGGKFMEGGKNIKLYYRKKVSESRPGLYTPDREQLVLYKSNG